MEQKSYRKVDSRDVKGFGQIATLPPESNFSVGVPLTIELPSEVDCTEISACKVATSKTKKIYDIKKNWSYVQSTPTGVDPRVTLGQATKLGLWTVDGQLDKTFNSYFRADIGSQDTFDNVRNNMQIAQSSAQANTQFYKEWLNVLPNEVLPDGVTVISDHSWTVLDWKIVNGVTMFLVDFDLGQTQYMTREQFNKEMKVSGCTSFILSTQVIQNIVNRGIMTTIIDLCKNAIILLNQLLIMQPQAPTSPIQPTSTPTTTNVSQALKYPKLVAWANAICHFEGHFDGNLKFSTLTQSWGASKGRPATDGGFFCAWKDNQTGFQALCNFLQLGCENQLLAFHQARTLGAFTKVFAGNPPQGYIDGISREINTPEDTDISTFLL